MYHNCLGRSVMPMNNNITKKSADATESSRAKMVAKKGGETSGTSCSFSFGCKFTQKKRRAVYRRAGEILIERAMMVML